MFATDKMFKDKKNFMIDHISNSMCFIKVLTANEMLMGIFILTYITKDRICFILSMAQTHIFSSVGYIFDKIYC